MAVRARIVAVGIRLSLTLLTSAVVVGTGEAEAGQLQASWVDNSGGVATTRIERRLSAETSFVQIADVPPGTSEYTDSSVTSGQTYCYRALAYDETGDSPYSNEACATVASSTVTTLDVTVTKAGTGLGLVTSTPSGISCDPVCAVTFAGGSSVTLAAAPDTGSTFTGWSGGGCSGTSSCTLTGNTAVTVTATFANDTTTTDPTTPPPATTDTTPPQVALSVPATFVRRTKVTLSATASDDVGVAKVDFYINESKVLCSDGTSPYSCTWQIPNAPNKSYVLQAKAMDTAGNVGVSPRITIVPE